MKAVDFKGRNAIYGKDQPEYNPLPVHKTESGEVTSVWEISDEEFEEIKKTRRVRVTQLTFNQNLQPLKLEAHAEHDHY